MAPLVSAWTIVFLINAVTFPVPPAWTVLVGYYATGQVSTLCANGRLHRRRSVGRVVFRVDSRTLHRPPLGYTARKGAGAEYTGAQRTSWSAARHRAASIFTERAIRPSLTVPEPRIDELAKPNAVVSGISQISFRFRVRGLGSSLSASTQSSQSR
jgi:hypothetical protein